MKKLLTTCSVLMASTTLAQAEYSDPTIMDNLDMNNFYIGADLGYAQVDYKSSFDALAEDVLPMLNVYMGYNIDSNYAIEFGSFITTKEDRNVNGTKTDADEHGFFVDAVTKHEFYPDFSVLGTAGIQYSKLKVKNSAVNFSESEVAARLGTGVEYKVNDTTKVRGMARYVFSDYENTVGKSMQYTIGMNYSF